LDDPGSSATEDAPWRRELAQRKGGEKGYKGGEKGRYKGGEKGRDDKGKSKGKPSKGWRGPTGYAAGYTAWSGWGPTGGQAAETDKNENDGGSDYMLIFFCIFLVLVGMGLASRAFRRPLARLVRRIAFIIDDGVVRAPALLEPFNALHVGSDSAAVRAMPARAEESEVRSRACGARSAAAREPGFTGERFSPSTVDQGSQSLNDNQQRHWDKHHCHGRDMRTQTRWLVDSGCGIEVSTQTVDKNFTLRRMTVYELKTMAKDHGLQTSGLKHDLVLRIEQHLASQLLAGR
jgi:hypothetical protein